MTGTPFGGFVSGLFSGIEARHGWDDRKRRQKLEDEDYEFRRKQRQWAAEDQEWQTYDRSYTRSERERIRADREAERALAEQALDAAKAAQAGRSIEDGAPAADPGAAPAQAAPEGSPRLAYPGQGGAPIDGIMRPDGATPLGYGLGSPVAPPPAAGVYSPFATPGASSQEQLGYGAAITPAQRDLSLNSTMQPDVVIAQTPPFVPNNHISKAELDPKIQELDARLGEIYAEEDAILKAGGMVNAGFEYQKKALQDERIARWNELQQAAGGEFNRDPIRQSPPQTVPGRGPALGYRSIEEGQPAPAGPDAPVQPAAPQTGLATLTSPETAAAAASGAAPPATGAAAQLAGREIAAPVSAGAATGAPRGKAAKGAPDPVDSFMDAYITEGIPLLVEGYLKMGQYDKAMQFQKFAEDAKTQKTMRIWAEAVRAASIGDANGVLDKMTEYHGKIDDGLTVVREKSDYIRDENGNIQGINITLKRDDTGEEFTQTYSGMSDFMDQFVLAGAPENIFEYLKGQTDAQAEADKDELKHQRSIELAKIRGNSGSGASREEAVDYLTDNDPTFLTKTPAEQEAAIDGYMALISGSGAPAPGSMPPPVYR